MIPEPRDQQANRRRRGSNGGRPPRFDSARYRGRNVIERGYCRLKQWRGLATRYHKLAIVYRAAVVLNGVVAWLNYLTDTPSVLRGWADGSPSPNPAALRRATAPAARPSRPCAASATRPALPSR